MTYTVQNFKTKKAVKEALQEGPQEIFEPGLGSKVINGTVSLEGPHYPQPHRWYGQGVVKNGKLVSTKK